MFYIFRRTKKRRKSREIRDLRVPPEGLEPSTHGLRDCANTRGNPAVRLRKSLIINGLDQIGSISLHCNSLKNAPYSSAKVPAYRLIRGPFQILLSIGKSRHAPPKSPVQSGRSFDESRFRLAWELDETSLEGLSAPFRLCLRLSLRLCRWPHPRLGPSFPVLQKLSQS